MSVDIVRQPRVLRVDVELRDFVES